MTDFKAEALAAEQLLESRRKDPLLWYRWASENHRKVPRSLVAGNETAVRSPNQAGKTNLGAHLVVGMLRGTREIDGEPIPFLGSPCTGLLLVHSYKLASESSVKMLLEAIGDWPHKIEMGSQNTVQAVRVRPDNSRSDDPRDWSRIIVHPEEGPLPTGMRLDFAWGDEPPAEKYWRQIRGRRRANRPFVRLITFTPLERARWEWLRKEFKPRPYPGKEGLCEVRLNLKDNRFLSKAHLQAMEADFANDPLKDAVLAGEYVDDTGLCPFDSRGLQLWETRCYEGRKEQFDQIRFSRDSEYTEVWYDPETEEDYFVVCDPSSGIYDPRGVHDPAGIAVISRLNPRLVARYSGYRNATELGSLAASLARKYNNALVVHERNSSYGEAFLTGCGDYGNLYIEHRTDRAKRWFSDRIGWLTNNQSRGTIIGALQKAVKEDLLLVHSLAAVDSLGTVIQGADRKIIAAPGYHDEDMIVLGLGCHLLETMPLYRQPRPEKGSEKLVQGLGLRMRENVEPDPFQSF